MLCMLYIINYCCVNSVAAGGENKIGWAFGVGLDRLVMTQYSIPDIRMLWTEDSRFLDQFAFKNPDTVVTFKVSIIFGYIAYS